MAERDDTQPRARASLHLVSSFRSRREARSTSRWTQESSGEVPIDSEAAVIPLPGRTGRHRAEGIEHQTVPTRANELDPDGADPVAGSPYQSHGSITSFRVELGGRRASSSVSGPDGLATCPCGGAWWRLEAGENGEPGAIVLAPDLSVTGWSGTPVCVLCDRPIETSTT